MPKKEPLRQCVACREHKPKRELARVVRTADGQVLYDGRGKVSGRGAYVCRDIACLERAIKIRALPRALDTPIDEQITDTLRRQMREEAEEDG